MRQFVEFSWRLSFCKVISETSYFSREAREPDVNGRIRTVIPRRTSVSYRTSVGAPCTGVNARLKVEEKKNEGQVVSAEPNTVEDRQEVLEEGKG